MNYFITNYNHEAHTSPEPKSLETLESDFSVNKNGGKKATNTRDDERSEMEINVRRVVSTHMPTNTNKRKIGMDGLALVSM